MNDRHISRGLAHRAVGALSAVVLFATLVAVPFMDGVAVEYDAVIESEHGACDYVRIHDHAICVQVGSNLAVESGVQESLALHPGWGRVAASPANVASLPAPPVAYLRTRAPPTL